MGLKANFTNVLPAGCKSDSSYLFLPSNLILPLIVLIIALVLPLSGCIPYLVGVAVTSRSQANARKDCVEIGGEYIDGSSWGWTTGKCMMPNERANLEKMSPQERCAFFEGTYSNGACNFSPEQECANLGGVYYASTGACDLRNTDSSTESTTESTTTNNQPRIEKNKNTISPQECANLGGIYYASTDACDLRHTKKESEE